MRNTVFAVLICAYLACPSPAGAQDWNTNPFKREEPSKYDTGVYFKERNLDELDKTPERDRVKTVKPSGHKKFSNSFSEKGRHTPSLSEIIRDQMKPADSER